MTISIALCTYNGAAFLAEQLGSILRQTHLPNQVVISDDGSSDDTAGIVQRFASAAPFWVRWMANATQLGVSANFWQAMQHCTGDIVVLADQDDVWHPDKLAIIKRTFANNPTAGYLFSDADLINANGQALGRRLWQETNFNPARQRQYQHDPLTVLLRRNVVTGATMAFRASVLAQLPPASPAAVHDFWLAFLASALGHTGIAIATPLMRYRIHAAQKIGLRGLAAPEAERYQREITSMADLSRDLEQLSAAPNGAKITCAIGLLQARRAHFQSRMHIRNAHGVPRLRLWLRELRTQRYGIFSHGWRGALKDFLIYDF